jgi:hypothetical protein
MASYRGRARTGLPLQRSTPGYQRCPTPHSASVRTRTAQDRHTHQVEHLARGNEVMQRVHDLFDGRAPVPPVHVKDVDVRRAQLRERRLKGDAQRLGRVATVVDLLSNLSVVLLEVSRVLQSRGVSAAAPRHKMAADFTFVAMTIWSRFLSASIHSPMILSDCSSWL